jgi:DNA-binding IclR family transcriptional regulator
LNQFVDGESCLKKESRGIQSVEVGGRLLEALVVASQPMNLRDLSATADVPAAHAHAYIISFRKLGFIEQDPSTGQYRLGPFAMRLGVARLRSDRALTLGSEAARDLCLELGVTVTLAVWGCGAPTVLEVQEGLEEININLREGRVFSVAATVTGRVFAAFGDPAPIKERLALELARRSHQPVAETRSFMAEYRSAVALARKQGYLQAVGIALPGVTAIAVPVLDVAGEMLYALTLVGREDNLDTSSHGRPVRALLAKSKAITEALRGAQVIGTKPGADTTVRRAAVRS